MADRDALERVYDAVRQDLGPVTIVVTSAGIEAFDPIAERHGREVGPRSWRST